MTSNEVQYITLTLGANMVLKNPIEVMTEMLRYYTLAPSNFNDELLSPNNVSISLTDTISKYESDKNTLIEVIERELIQGFRSCFQGAEYIEVGVSTKDIKANCYTLSISPVIGMNGNVYTLSKTLMSYKGKLSFVNDNVSPMDWMEMIENGEVVI